MATSHRVRSRKFIAMESRLCGRRDARIRCARDFLSWKGRRTPLPVIPGTSSVSLDADGRPDSLTNVLQSSFPTALASDVEVAARFLPSARAPVMRSGCSARVGGKPVALDLDTGTARRRGHVIVGAVPILPTALTVTGPGRLLLGASDGRILECVDVGESPAVVPPVRLAVDRTPTRYQRHR